MERQSSAKRDRRYRLVYNSLAPFARLISHAFSSYTTRHIKPREQFIVVANHLTEVDFFMVCNLVRRHMYIVVSEHLHRGGLFGAFVVHVLNPVFRCKGAVDLASVAEMLRRLKQGNNLMLFPEGHRSADGVTLEVEKSIGTLIKRANCSLITIKITGGYFREPRWALHTRWGPMSAGIVGVYSPQQLQEMSAAQVAELVNRDIYEDAYARQLQAPKAYWGRKLAEGLENHLFLCPRCQRISTLHTQGDRLWCPCGLEGRYDQYALLRGLPFTTVREWSLWQAQRFLELCQEKPGELLCRDENVTLSRITKDHQKLTLAQGVQWADDQGLHIGNLDFPYAQMQTTAFNSRGNTLFFQTREGYFELHRAGVCQLKYQLLWNHYRKAEGRGHT